MTKKEINQITKDINLLTKSFNEISKITVKNMDNKNQVLNFDDVQSALCNAMDKVNYLKSQYELYINEECTKEEIEIINSKLKK